MGANESEKKQRITENLDFILQESKFRFQNTKEAWSDLEKKAFVLLGFVPIFIGFLVINDLLSLLTENISIIYKLSLLAGIFFVLYSGFQLIGLILPEHFKTSASEKDLINIMKENKFFSAKKRLIQIYVKMNDDNKARMSERADILRSSAYRLLIGTTLILISKSYPIILFLAR